MLKNTSAILLIHCKDQPGIVVSITDFIFSNRGNIINLDQHVDTDQQRFFMRVEWELENFTLPVDNIGTEFDNAVAKRFGMHWQIHFSSDVPRMAVFVSKLPHCFYDILARCHSGEWRVELPLIISNHEDMELVAKLFGY